MLKYLSFEAVMIRIILPGPKNQAMLNWHARNNFWHLYQIILMLNSILMGLPFLKMLLKILALAPNIVHHLVITSKSATIFRLAPRYAPS